MWPCPTEKGQRRDTVLCPQKKRTRLGEKEKLPAQSLSHPHGLTASEAGEPHTPEKQHHGKGYIRSSYQLLPEQRKTPSLRLGASAAGPRDQGRLLRGGDT